MSNQELINLILSPVVRIIRARFWMFVCPIFIMFVFNLFILSKPMPPLILIKFVQLSKEDQILFIKNKYTIIVNILHAVVNFVVKHKFVIVISILRSLLYCLQ
jgi:hypothetical protein